MPARRLARERLENVPVAAQTASLLGVPPALRWRGRHRGGRAPLGPAAGRALSRWTTGTPPPRALLRVRSKCQVQVNSWWLCVKQGHLRDDQQASSASW